MSQNINKIMKQAQKLQAQVMQAQQDLQNKQFEGTAGGGMVKAVVNGGQELMSIAINREVVDPDDVEMLEDLIVAAVKNAQEKIKAASDATFGGISGQMNIPGFNLPG
ncbi:MAG TPA: YbaB/EbfC family nucleoid-associated protein [Chitinivibrionales bacterium]